MENWRVDAARQRACSQMKREEQVADSVGGAAGEWEHQQMEVKESLSDWGRAGGDFN